MSELTKQDLLEAIDGLGKNIFEGRHETTAHLVESINKVKLDQINTDKTVVLLEKNLTELKGIASATHELMKFHTETLSGKVDDHGKVMKLFISDFYKLDMVSNYKTNTMVLNDHTEKLLSLKKVDEKQTDILTKHDRWFFAGWIVTAVFVGVLKLLPLIASMSK